MDQATINNAIELFKTTVTKHYMDFNGRVSRKDFWTYVVVVILLMLAVAVVQAVLGLQILGPLVGLGLLLPNLGMTIRRLHDVGKSGALALALAGATALSNVITLMTVSAMGPMGAVYAFWSFGPILGLLALVELALAVILIYLCVQPGSSEANAYGAAPAA